MGTKGRRTIASFFVVAIVWAGGVVRAAEKPLFTRCSPATWCCSVGWRTRCGGGPSLGTDHRHDEWEDRDGDCGFEREVDGEDWAVRGGRALRVDGVGAEKIKLTNVMVGDVWVCSGQSNMEMGIGIAYDKDHEIAAANYPNLRLFTVPKHVVYEPQAEFGKNARQPEEAKWLACTPQNIMVGDWGGFSAVAYFFGHDLHEAERADRARAHVLGRDDR